MCVCELWTRQIISIVIQAKYIKGEFGNHIQGYVNTVSNKKPNSFGYFVSLHPFHLLLPKLWTCGFDEKWFDRGFQCCEYVDPCRCEIHMLTKRALPKLSSSQTYLLYQAKCTTKHIYPGLLRQGKPSWDSENCFRRQNLNNHPTNTSLGK